MEDGRCKMEDGRCKMEDGSVVWKMDEEDRGLKKKDERRKKMEAGKVLKS